MPPSYHLIVVVSIACLQWLGATSIVYYAIRFYKLRHSQIIVKRYYKLTMLTIMCTLLAIMIFFPYNLIMTYLEEINQSNSCIRYTNRCLWSVYM